MTMLEYYERKIVQLEKEKKEIDFLIENLKFGFKKGIIKSEKIYSYYLETYTIKKKRLAAKQDDYYMSMARLKPLEEKKGNTWLGGVV